MPLEPREFERRFLAEVLIELLADPERTRSRGANEFVLLKELALYRAIYLDGEHPDTEIFVLFSFAGDPAQVFGFRQKVWDGLEAWDDGRGKSIFNDPEKAAMMFCVYFEENLEPRGPQEHRVPAALEGPVWIPGSHA